MGGGYYKGIFELCHQSTFRDFQSSLVLWISGLSIDRHLMKTFGILFNYPVVKFRDQALILKLIKTPTLNIHCDLARNMQLSQFKAPTLDIEIKFSTWTIFYKKKFYKCQMAHFHCFKDFQTLKSLRPKFNTPD